MSIDCSSGSHIAFSTFTPGAKFAFPRSYIRSIAVVDRSTDVDFVDNEIIVHSTDLPDLSLHYVLEPRFLPFSSNAYTLDFVVCDAFYTFAPTYTPNNWAFNTTYEINPNDLKPMIVISAAFSALYRTYLSIPQPPDDWWSR